MKSIPILSIALCLALGACAAPTGPSVVAIAGDNVSDQKFARDAAVCRARAQPIVDRAAANGDLGLQSRFNSIYAQCMTDRGYQIEAPAPRYYYGPGPYYDGPGSYWGSGPYWGPGPFYGAAFSYGAGWGRRW